MKKLQNLKGAKLLGKKQQQSVNGGKPIEGPDCKCFCYSGNTQVTSPCRSLCPDGSIPGLISGGPECWTPNEY